MMFVFGEVREPLDDTSKYLEEVVRAQIIETISKGYVQAAAACRTHKLAAEDLIYTFRSDKEKVNRLRSFLSSKEVMNNY